MFKLILHRIAVLVPLLLAVALSAFLLVRLAPGDFVAELSQNPQISAQTLARMRTQYGLDQPWHRQFGSWLGGVARGDWGYSLSCHCPARQLLTERLANTVWLALAGLVLTLVVAVPLGVLAAQRRFVWLDHGLAGLVALCQATPAFLLALLAMVLAARSGWFPLGGVGSLVVEDSISGRWLDFGWHLILPASVLALRQAPGYFRQVRVSLLETLGQDYIVTARAKGLPERSVVLKHGLRNALPPALAMLGNSLGSLLSGAFIIEAVMSWPGLGRLTVDSLLSRDLPVLVACLVCAALVLALGNLLADVLLAWADPRIRPAKG
jgi:peptide/nickel transport system permease protein